MELYYEDAYQQSFTAQVIKTDHDDNGQYVVLTNTAFYPTGGGQPFDTGTIEQLAVTNVEKVDGEIRHYVEGDFTTLPTTVMAQLNWQRRFDHMQQHAGQHILTAAFVELFNIDTVSFHLGSSTVTIDLNVPAVTDEQLQAAEQLANDKILQNLPIETKWVTREEAASYPLRKQLAVEDEAIRLVIIPDFDYNGCGGTHPRSTGEVASLKILTTEKMKGMTRVHFVCGHRVLQELAMRKQVLANVSKHLNVPEAECDVAAQKLVQTLKEKEKALQEAQNALIAYEAQSYATEAFVAQVFTDRSMQQLQKLAREILAINIEATVLLASDNDGKTQFVAARSNKQQGSLKEIALQLLALLDGKGGGSDVLIQGGGDKLNAAQFIAQARNIFN